MLQHLSEVRQARNGRPRPSPAFDRWPMVSPLQMGATCCAMTIWRRRFGPTWWNASFLREFVLLGAQQREDERGHNLR
jgi:hypothetical protein